MANIKVRTRLYSSVGPVLLAAMSLATADAGWASCTFTPPLPSTTQTKCIAAVQIPGNPLRSFDISWVDPVARNTTSLIVQTRGLISSTPNPLSSADDRRLCRRQAHYSRRR